MGFIMIGGMSRRATVVAVAAIAVALSFAAIPVAANEARGVTPDRILFGQSAAMTGPANELGIEMRRGIAAAFAEVNRAGGVHGRRLELKSYDDRYEPEAAIANTRKLIEEDKIFALIGEVGTPTSKAVAPIAGEAGVPFIAPFTGAEFLRDPELSHVVNVRASYFEETEAIVAALVRDRDVSRIVVLYQDDSYGRSGLEGVKRALRRHSLAVAGTATYMRNTTAIKTALLRLSERRPEAIIVIGAYQPSAVFTRWARKLGIDAVVLNISFVGTNALAAALGPEHEGVYVSQVMPFPLGDGLPLLAQYRTALAAYDSDAWPGFGSLEGYVAGRLTVEVLRRLGPMPTRKGFLATLAETRSFDIGGFPLRFGIGDNRGSHQVFLTRIQGNGDVVPVERISP